MSLKCVPVLRRLNPDRCVLSNLNIGSKSHNIAMRKLAKERGWLEKGDALNTLPLDRPPRILAAVRML